MCPGTINGPVEHSVWDGQLFAKQVMPFVDMSVGDKQNKPLSNQLKAVMECTVTLSGVTVQPLCDGGGICGPNFMLTSVP